MGKSKAIPSGYCTVGGLAKKMGVTVRTLQYYDEEELLSPSAESEGGRRLYTDKDMVKLHQILSLKSLGFSLDDIKNRLIPLDTPAEVAGMLAGQADAIREKMAALAQSLAAIEALRAEVLQMRAVDFKKYADIIVNLQMKNEFYWMIKHFDEETLAQFRTRFDEESSRAVIEAFPRLLEEAARLQQESVPPGGEEGRRFAQTFWQLVTDFTGGDMQMLPRLMQAESWRAPDEKARRKQEAALLFIEASLDAYFTALGYDPLKGETT